MSGEYQLNQAIAEPVPELTNQSTPEPKPEWTQCMFCYSSNYSSDNHLAIPSHGVCESDLCRLEFALSCSEKDDDVEEIFNLSIEKND